VLGIADAFRQVLVPFLLIGTATLLFLLMVLIVQRLVRAAMGSRRATISRRYQPIIDAALHSDTISTLHAVLAIPTRHRRVAGELLLAAGATSTPDAGGSDRKGPSRWGSCAIGSRSAC